MILFWMTIGLLGAGLSVLVIATAARERHGAREQVLEAEVARRQMAEIDALKRSGLIDAEGHAAARAETARRLMAHVPGAEPRAPRPGDGRLVLVAVMAVMALSLGLYVMTGSPGRADQPHFMRVSKWASIEDGLDPLRASFVAERRTREQPGDVDAWRTLARTRFEGADYIGAISAFRRAIMLEPGDAVTWARLGEAITRTHDGQVSADAEAAFRQAQSLDPDMAAARYFLGLAAIERGEREEAARQWQPLFERLNPSDPRVRAMQALLTEAR